MCVSMGAVTMKVGLAEMGVEVEGAGAAGAVNLEGLCTGESMVGDHSGDLGCQSPGVEGTAIEDGEIPVEAGVSSFTSTGVAMGPDGALIGGLLRRGANVGDAMDEDEEAVELEREVVGMGAGDDPGPPDCIKSL